MRLPIVLIGVALLWYLIIHAVLMGGHVLDLSWPAHARNHILRAMFLGTGTSLLGYVILLGPFQRRETWAWWAMLILAVFTMGGFWIATAFVEFGSEFEWKAASIGFGISTLLFGIGLWLAYPPGPSPR